jgi:hypothetical protein
MFKETLEGEKYKQMILNTVKLVVPALLTIMSMTVESLQAQQQGSPVLLLSGRTYYEPDSSFGSGENELHVIGEIMNNSSMMIGPVKVIATFYDAAGQIVGSEFTYADINRLAPGQKAPFEIIVGGSWGGLSVPVVTVRDVSLAFE